MNTPEQKAGPQPWRAEVPVGAIDADHGVVDKALSLSAPWDTDGIITPLTSLAELRAERGAIIWRALVARERRQADAAAAAAAKTPAAPDPMNDCSDNREAQDRAARDVARMLVLLQQQMLDNIISRGKLGPGVLTEARDLIDRQLLLSFDQIIRMMNDPAYAAMVNDSECSRALQARLPEVVSHNDMGCPPRWRAAPSSRRATPSTMAGATIRAASRPPSVSTGSPRKTFSRR
jgi:hypothetical protein